MYLNFGKYLKELNVFYILQDNKDIKMNSIPILIIKNPINLVGESQVPNYLRLSRSFLLPFPLESSITHVKV